MSTSAAPNTAPSSKKLRDRLLDDDAAVRQAAFEELNAAAFGRQRTVLQAIIRRAVRPKSKIQQRAVDVLRQQACLSLMLLRAGLFLGRTGRQRAQKARLLGEVAPQGDREAVQALHDTFGVDEDPLVERAAVAAIEQLDPEGRVWPY